jgi:hypothetical protein
VQDNLNTHKPASLFEAHAPAEARRLVERFEWHDTPKHGGRLVSAESQRGVRSSLRLDRRNPNRQMLPEEVAARRHSRNKHHVKADWNFTTANVSTRPKRL